jgi:hypothetical protein
MTTAEMTNELEKDGHDRDNAREIAAELAGIAAAKAARKAKAAKKAKTPKVPKTLKVRVATKAESKAARAVPMTKKVVKAPKKAATLKKDGPTAGILAMAARRKNGFTTAEVHAAFPTTAKSDVLTRLAKKGLLVHAGPGQWAASKGGTR